jgi:hypothetical protein
MLSITKATQMLILRTTNDVCFLGFEFHVAARAFSPLVCLSDINILDEVGLRYRLQHVGSRKVCYRDTMGGYDQTSTEGLAIVLVVVRRVRTKIYLSHNDSRDSST